MAVGLSGNLVDFGIADVFQLIGQQRKTGILELRSDSSRAQLIFDEGMVVSAAPATGRAGELDPLADRLIRCGQMTNERAEEAVAACRASAQTLARTLVERGWLDPTVVATAEELVTRDTIFEVLRWRSGFFDFRAQEISHDRDRAQLLGAEQILMDGLRMVDEWQSFASAVPSDDTVFQRADGFDAFVSWSKNQGRGDAERAQRIFGHVDGRLSARRVIDLAQLGTFDGTRCLAELRESGAIRLANLERVQAWRREHRANTARAHNLRRLVAGMIPLAVLAGVVWWTAISSAAVPTAAPGIAIERSSLAGLREAYAARVVRHAIEAYRLSRGRWPERLEDLERAGLIPADVLATPHGRPYYSKHRDQGLVFLAPER